MKKFFLFFISFSIAVLSNAQILSSDQQLPFDTGIKQGVLPNGLTYYIKSTDAVKDAASYYIIQNVGSVLENDDQQGLAHFLEHMAFNGTKNFKGKGILETFQKEGLLFGKDINAYTSFDETVYNINNVPTTPELIDTGLLVLHNWCNYLLLTDEEIDAERGVIKEEWRTRQSGSMRLFQTSLPVTFNNSKYSKRLPIGLMDIVENFKYKALRDFYHDWYRTDLQAIAIIGDIDVGEIEKKIVKLFSTIPAVKNPRKRYEVEIPDHEELLYSLGTDPEISTASIEFGIRHLKPSKKDDIKYLETTIKEYLVTSMLSSRISEIIENTEVSFLVARVNYSEISRLNKTFNINIAPKPGLQKKAFAEVITEIVRAVKHGFTPTEIETAKKRLLGYYEGQISKKDDRPHRSYIQPIKENFLDNVTILDVEAEYELTKQIFKNLNSEKLHQTIKGLYSKQNRFLNVTGVEGKDNLTKEAAQKIVSDIEKDSSITLYEDKSIGESLIFGLNIEPGSIIDTKENPLLGSTTFTLSNGIKVHYKFADKQKNQVDFLAKSDGGLSMLTSNELPSALTMNQFTARTGIGSFSQTNLRKVLAGKTVGVYPQIQESFEQLSGGATIKDIEIMFQLVYLYFEHPRFDEKAYKDLKTAMNNLLERKKKDLSSMMRDSVTTTIYGKNHPRKRIIDRSYVDDMSIQKFKEIYLKRFENPGDFEFYIVGDIDIDTLKPFLEKYIAGLPTTNVKESYKDSYSEWSSNNIDKDIFLEMEDPKTSVNIALKFFNDYTVKNRFVSRALGDILKLRLIEKLREEEGGVYTPSVRSGMFRYPRTESYLSIKFDCNPDLAESLIEIVHDEIAKIAKGEIETIDLDKTITNYKIERSQAKNNSNGYDMRLLFTYHEEGYDMNDKKNFEDVIANITKKDLQNLAKELLKGKSYEIVFKPLKK
jgi:zinc protease